MRRLLFSLIGLCFFTSYLKADNSLIHNIKDFVYSSTEPITAYDYDGRTEYSPIRTVFFGESTIPVAIYPNPASNHLTIENGKGQIIIYDILGKEIKKLHNSKVVKTINTGFLSKGHYIIKVLRQNGTIHSAKFVIAD